MEDYKIVKIGDKIEDIEVQAYHNEEVKKIKLSSYKGKWVCLVFYPADFTFICPTELVELANKYKEFQSEGAELLSVSTDTVFVHKAWHDNSESIKKIKYPICHFIFIGWITCEFKNLLLKIEFLR